MAILSPASMQALNRLRAFVPPSSTYSSLPLSRRAAVLLLLFADQRGDLRVVLTLRASTLKSYPGQAALPGGKADALTETPFQTARREASEEIGLPAEARDLPSPFRVEHICELPHNLAKTELVVRPCVAFLHSGSRNAEESLIPRLDAAEVAAVFSAPFHNFLRAEDEVEDGGLSIGDPSDWYEGQWTDWHESRWRMHNFHVPIAGQHVTKPKRKATSQHAAANHLDQAEEAGLLTRYRVFGMTARMVVDAARVAYGEEPEFEHNSHFGDEMMIERLQKTGKLGEKRKSGAEISKEDMVKAAKM